MSGALFGPIQACESSPEEQPGGLDLTVPLYRQKGLSTRGGLCGCSHVIGGVAVPYRTQALAHAEGPRREHEPLVSASDAKPRRDGLHVGAVESFERPDVAAVDDPQQP